MGSLTQVRSARPARGFHGNPKRRFSFGLCSFVLGSDVGGCDRAAMTVEESLFDSPEADAKSEARVEADVRAGRLISHEAVKRWLSSWGSDKRLPRHVPATDLKKIVWTDEVIEHLEAIVTCVRSMMRDRGLLASASPNFGTSQRQRLMPRLKPFTLAGSDEFVDHDIQLIKNRENLAPDCSVDIPAYRFSVAISKILMLGSEKHYCGPEFGFGIEAMLLGGSEEMPQLVSHPPHILRGKASSQKPCLEV